MMFHWTADMIRFMRDASEYGDYNRRLAEKMKPWLTPDTHICDAGCGLGYLSLELAPLVKRVTAIDINENALAVLRENCRARGIQNIHIRRENLFELSAEVCFDSMAFCTFGNIGEILASAKKHCRGEVFVIQRSAPNHQFSAGNHPRDPPSSDPLQLLRQKGIPVESEELELELGQPFRSWQDARLFFETYNRDDSMGGISTEFLRRKVRETGKKDFPLYMSYRRPIRWLFFHAKDIPQEQEE